MLARLKVVYLRRGYSVRTRVLSQHQQDAVSGKFFLHAARKSVQGAAIGVIVHYASRCCEVEKVIAPRSKLPRLTLHHKHNGLAYHGSHAGLASSWFGS